MALIICSECGKEFSNKAVSCPNCGCPIEEIIKEESLDNSQEEVEIEETGSTASKAWAVIKTGANTISERQKEAIKCTKSIGPVQIDENHSMFRINGSVPVNGKKAGAGKSLFKGFMAVGTMGMSVAAEKIVGGGKQKVGDKTWLNFSDLINYDLLEDDSIVTSGGVGQALIGGALFGGFGAVAGGITGKRKQKKKVENLIIKVTLNNFGCPCLMIPLITKSTKIDSKEYKNAFNDAHTILSALDVITHNK